MGLHLYCVTPAEHLPHEVTGLDDAPVATVLVDGLAVWVSDMDARAGASIESAQRHHAVVEAAMRSVTPVPLRFGQWLPDEDAVRTRAAARAAEWREQLLALAGTAEFTVRILDPAIDGPARDVRGELAGSGRAYLEAVAAPHASSGARAGVQWRRRSKRHLRDTWYAHAWTHSIRHTDARLSHSWLTATAPADTGAPWTGQQQRTPVCIS